MLRTRKNVPLPSLLLITSDEEAMHIASGETQLVSCEAVLKKAISPTHSVISNLVLT